MDFGGWNYRILLSSRGRLLHVGRDLSDGKPTIQVASSEQQQSGVVSLTGVGRTFRDRARIGIVEPILQPAARSRVVNDG